MKRSGEALLAVVALIAAAPEAVNAQVMSSGACETHASRLAETLGIVPGPDIEDGAFVVASASGCSLRPVSSTEHIAPQLARAVASARAGRALPDRERVIVYVNGMAVTPEIQCETMREIAAVTGATVVGVHNATEGIASDAAEVMAQRELIQHRRSGGPLTLLGRSRNPAVSAVRRLVIASAVAGTSPPEIWAHSQGGAIASLALYEANDIRPGSLKDVAVVTFASAAPFFPAGPRYEHYVHTEDAVPRYTGLGRLGWFDDAKAGANAKVIRFSGEHFLPAAANVGAPDLSHHDILVTYLPRYLREHGRPASLIQWSRP